MFAALYWASCWMPWRPSWSLDASGLLRRVLPGPAPTGSQSISPHSREPLRYREEWGSEGFLATLEDPWRRHPPSSGTL